MGETGQMKYFLLLFTLLSFILKADTFLLDGVEFVYRTPQDTDKNSRIMILFGGRNWPGKKTLETFRFDALADRHSLFLLAPSFRDRNYWEPEKWSGPLLLRAVTQLEKKYKLTPQKFLFYGYSAGGQCANLFYAWMPKRVAAWGVHGCGIYFTAQITKPSPGLISCGLQDRKRFEISRHFLYRYREAGAPIIWKYFNGGHELSQQALELARAWFEALLEGRTADRYGEDDTFRIVPATDGKSIDPEFRNPLFSGRLEELWRK